MSPATIPHCPGCGSELRWHECEGCDGRGVHERSLNVACLLCDAHGGWYVCEAEGCRWSGGEDYAGVVRKEGP